MLSVGRCPFSVRRSTFAIALIAAFDSAALAQESGSAVRPGFRAWPLEVSAAGRTGFTLMAGERTGIAFTNTLSRDRMSRNHNLLNGSGVAIGDYDSDGWCDLYFCNLEGRSRLFRNLGNWKFEDTTAAAGVEVPNQASTGAVFADLNGDGLLDLLVNSCGGPNACFVNIGSGRFTNGTEQAGLTSKLGSTSLALADVDGDGDLDLYVANYGENTIRSGLTISTRTVNGKEVVVGRYANRLKIIDGHLVEFGEPDVFYLNDGGGRFSPVSWTGGQFLDEEGKPFRTAPWDMGLSAMFRDLDGDGAPDLYVCNDFQTPDRVWLNDGRGRFRALDRLALRQSSNFAMAVDFADVNRDGRVDFFVADMLSRYHPLRMTQKDGSERLPALPGRIHDRPQVRRNMLYLNRGDGTFADLAHYSRVAASDWTWSAVFLDVDLDGYEDLLIGNGHAFDTQDFDTNERNRMKQATLFDFPPLETPNLVFRNRGDLTFEEVGARWGFDSRQVSHGLALGDFDNDGDLDVAVNCLNAPALVYRNDSDAPRIAVRLNGRRPNVQGIGAHIRLTGGPAPVQTQEIIAGGRYLSGDEPRRVFAAGSMTNRIRIEVTWRDGKQSVIAEARPNHRYDIDEIGATPPPATGITKNPLPLFEDHSDQLAQQHHETAYDDFERQPLLPWKLSQLGPGLAWLDWDGDGADELVVGSGRGGQLTLCRRGAEGKFVSAAIGKPAAGDSTGLVAWTPRPGRRWLTAGMSHYELGATNVSALVHYDSSFRDSDESWALIESAQPGPASSVGPLAVADIDADGDLDLFAGGRVRPGRYPEPASSFLFRNQAGKFDLDSRAQTPWRNLGLVSGALFADLTGDGLPELILACDWGPLRIFINEAGEFLEATRDWGLENYTGWWTGIAAGDFDEDGRLDLVAGNWGLNSSYRCAPDRPLWMFYGDFDGNQTVDLIEAYTERGPPEILPGRNLVALSGAMPFLRGFFPTHRSFSTATVPEILRDRFAGARSVQATTLASAVFLNRTNRFEMVPLPPEAQWAPVFGINVGDADGDGHEDIFLSQNFFSIQAEQPRLDAGRGLWLLGDGRGQFQPLGGERSGIRIYGEQRGSALADFDRDGRVDLAVAQNGAETKLYRNRGARPGIRVRLSGPPGNPDGVGAVIRLGFGPRWGPARVVSAGSGYWSQDSAVPVLGAPQPPTELEVRWPGGKVTRGKMPDGAKEVQAEVSGAIRAVSQ